LQKVNVLLIGSGGREHAIAHALSKSKSLGGLHCARGNGGISELAKCHDVSETDFDGLLKICEENSISLVVVGPETPLVEGIVDFFRSNDIRCFGPKKDAAILEGSKDFAKRFMKKHNIPTARSESFKELKLAIEFVRLKSWARVIKASGLAAGKGVIVCDTKKEAIAALEKIMDRKIFGAAGDCVVIEERLEGQEASILAFTDGTAIVPMIPSQDHKRAFDDDKGLNTGGMGAYAPTPFVDKVTEDLILNDILLPTMIGLSEDGIDYVGVLYAGLMLTKDGPKVIEFNCRFGDPETQAVLPLLESDLLEIMLACTEKRLDQIDIRWKRGFAATVVAASGGYPEKYEVGKNILIEPAQGTIVFHSGTEKKDETLLTSGGRVLSVTALGDTLHESIDKAYNGLSMISFEGMHHRKDIGRKALSELKEKTSASPDEIQHL